MKRGSVWDYVVGSRQLRVVIVSANRYNPGRALCAPVLQHGNVPAPTTIMVALGEGDPVAGLVNLAMIRNVVPEAVREHRGQLAPITLRQVDQALRTYLDL